MSTVLLIAACVIYGSTAAVIGAATRTNLLSRTESEWSTGAAWTAGWIIGLLWPFLVLAAALLLKRRGKP